jgi:hypothetical protein
MLSTAVLIALIAQNEERVAEAKRLFAAGEEYFRREEYANAVIAFEAAYDRFPTAAITFSIAQSYRLWHFLERDPRRLKRAIDAYRRYLREQEKGGRRSDALEHLATLEGQLGDVVMMPPVEEPPKVTRLMVTSQTDGAVVSIDGADASGVPLTREVPPGKHEIVVSADGFFTQTLALDVPEGELASAAMTLVAKPATLVVDAPSGSDVRIDGQSVGVAPLGPLALGAGKHTVVVSEVGHHPFVRDLEVGRGQTASVEVDLGTTFQRKLSYWFIGAGAASLVGTGVVVAVALGSEAQARFLVRKRDVDMVNLSFEERDDYIRARDRRNDLLAASSAGLAAGVLLSAIGGALYLFDAPDLEGINFGATVLAPAVGPESLGVTYGGRF